MKKQPNKKTATKRTKKPKNTGSLYKYGLGELYLAIPIAIIVLFLAGYLARGWVRYHAEPAIYYWSVDDSKKVLKQQSNELGSPFNRMGFVSASERGNCSLTYANGFHSQFDCETQDQSYMNDVRALKPSLAARGMDLQKSLLGSGWKQGNTTLAELTSNISKGIDYTPDATYLKNVSGYTCMISFTTAFSKPKPPAVNATMDCSRIYELLGSTPQI